MRAAVRDSPPFAAAPQGGCGAEDRAASLAAAGPVPGRLWRLPGVYAPQADTALLARALRRENPPPGTDLLDIGTGTGALAVLAARMGARVEATDVSWRAVLTARINAVRAGHRVSVRRRHLAQPPDGRRYDLVLSNPPYVPAPGAAPGHRVGRA
jgi:release factor glutamine methyltransferase